MSTRTSTRLIAQKIETIPSEPISKKRPARCTLVGHSPDKAQKVAPSTTSRSNSSKTYIIPAGMELDSALEKGFGSRPTNNNNTQEGSPKLQVIVPVRMAIEKADRFAASDRGFVDEKGSLAEEEPPPAQGGQTQEIPGIGRTGAKTATIAMSPKATVDDNRSQDKPDQRHLINGKESLREDESISDDGKEVLGTIPSLSILDPPPRQRHHQQQQQQQQQQRQQQQQIGASKDAEFTGRYLALKSSAWDWVITYFSTATHELDLLHLAHKTSPQLMEYANFISSCGDKTWEHVFHKQRATLVYGILGKMLEVHVFGHEMFGAAESQLAGLRAMDLKLIDEDGFFRQRIRAHQISAFLGTPTALPPNFHPSLSALHADFLHMLAPLLPPAPPPTLPRHLLDILRSAATLSLDLRRQEHTVYHWQSHPAIGETYDPRAMHILNQIGVREQNLWRDPFDVQVVTMAGWPSCVAYRSKGDQVKTIGRAEVQVTWGKPIKPLPLEPTNWLGRRLRVEMMARLERKEKGMRRLKVATGLALAAGVMVSRPGLLEGLKEGPPEGCEAEVRRWYREFRGWFV